MFKRIFWGITFILFAILLILQALGITVNIFNIVPLWKMFLMAMFLYWIIEQVIKKHFSHVIFPLVFLVMIFEDELALLFNVPGGDIAPWWGFLLVGFLLTAGLSLLTKKMPFIEINVNGKNKHGRKKDGFKLSGASVIYIDCASEANKPLNESIENDMGSYSVYFVNTEAYEGNGTLGIDNNLGLVTVYIPKNWVISNKIDNSLGSVQIPKPETSDNKKVLYLTGDNNLGTVLVEYVESETEESEKNSNNNKEKE